MEINKFRDQSHYFRRIGLNAAFSFKCFCNKHDAELFQQIEIEEIDFTNYQDLILLPLRSNCNELHRKKVNLKMRELMIEEYSEIHDIKILTEQNKQEALGISDLEKTDYVLWNDVLNSGESYNFQVREIEKIDICLSAFYNYETTQELLDYQDEHGMDKEDLADIFVTIFPYKDKTVFVMGYKKEDETQVKHYVNRYFKENEKRLLRRLTNLILFRCETWIISEKFYQERIKKCEQYFGHAADYSISNNNERRFFKLNLFGVNFNDQISNWWASIN
ncbi:MAG: hypothetical protein JKY52_11565 [Flavobacteriales bacterium]|nr:hypothetical protein [Flavobacteriales bacterium]